jgi:LacI family transcriptional regulator
VFYRGGGREMATIGDVAKLAGLSRATVSRVLNNHPYVSEEKKRLVHEAMDQLGYVPNSIAQRLRTQTMETVAVLVSRISNPFFSKMVEVMENIATENNFQLIVCQTGSNKSRELVYLDWLKTKQVGGVILASSQNDWDKIKDYKEFGPIMFCNEFPLEAEAPIVRLDQFKGGYLGTKHLIEKGYREIAYCSGDRTSTNMNDRKRGFDHALKEYGLTMPEDWWFEGTLDIEDGRRVLRKIVTLKKRPSAVFTGSDEVAAGIINEAKKNGLNVPKDLAVVGFDDQPIAELTDPQITTIHQPTEEIGEKSMSLMIDFLKGVKKPKQQIIELPLHLVERGSV